jgi:hypothetical protein
MTLQVRVFGREIGAIFSPAPFMLGFGWFASLPRSDSFADRTR